MEKRSNIVAVPMIFRSMIIMSLKVSGLVISCIIIGRGRGNVRNRGSIQSTSCVVAVMSKRKARGR